MKNSKASIKMTKLDQTRIYRWILWYVNCVTIKLLLKYVERQNWKTMLSVI